MTSQKLLTSETQIFGDRYGDHPANQRGYASGTRVRVCVYILLVVVDQRQGKDSFATIVVSEEIDMDKENVDLPERRKRRASRSAETALQLVSNSPNKRKPGKARGLPFKKGVTIVAVIALSRLVRLKRSSFLKMPGWHLRTWLKTSNVLLAVGWRVLPPLDHPH